ncbi:MAG: TraB/GumN family protein [Alphaproteobacteria bacterium]|nr:TraB/GumN family protein [Alphaproteobacteria bacterium]
MFVPNHDLYKTWEESENVGRYPYIAVFKKDGKTLIYIAEDHGANKSYDMTDFCFSDKSPAKPQIAVVEYRNSGRDLLPREIHGNNLAYVAAVAAKRGLPVVFADLSDEETLAVLREHRPDREFTEEDLRKSLSCGGPSVKKGEYNFFSHLINLHGRDPYMVNNIAAALNKYDVVLAAFGEGHYRSQRLILEDMMGKPEYIKDVPNTRGNFDDIKIEPIKLI